MAEHQKGVILLIEDNPDDETLVVRALRKRNIGNPIVVCHDGAEALEYVFGTGKFAGRSPTDFPAVTMLDLKLPKVDGLTILQRIRADERTRLMPVVVLTSSNQETDIVRSYELGANSYVRKPVEFEHFVDAVHQLGLHWLPRNESPPDRAQMPKPLRALILEDVADDVRP
jgi:two-component system response regulator